MAKLIFSSHYSSLQRFSEIISKLLLKKHFIINVVKVCAT